MEKLVDEDLLGHQSIFLKILIRGHIDNSLLLVGVHLAVPRVEPALFILLLGPWIQGVTHVPFGLSDQLDPPRLEAKRGFPSLHRHRQ